METVVFRQCVIACVRAHVVRVLPAVNCPENRLSRSIQTTLAKSTEVNKGGGAGWKKTARMEKICAPAPPSGGWLSRKSCMPLAGIFFHPPPGSELFWLVQKICGIYENGFHRVHNGSEDLKCVWKHALALHAQKKRSFLLDQTYFICHGFHWTTGVLGQGVTPHHLEKGLQLCFGTVFGFVHPRPRQYCVSAFSVTRLMTHACLLPPTLRSPVLPLPYPSLSLPCLALLVPVPSPCLSLPLPIGVRIDVECLRATVGTGVQWGLGWGPLRLSCSSSSSRTRYPSLSSRSWA